MQVPKRKAGEFTYITPDPQLTQTKYDSLINELEFLKKKQLPAIKEVKRLAEFGDFSENAAYQIAKGYLRGINWRIEELSDQLSHAVIINPATDNSQVKLGHLVTVEINGQKVIYQILGSEEINLEKNIISHNSPLGAALIGRASGETFSYKLDNREVKGRVLEISNK